MKTLNEDELKRARLCVANIKDKFTSVENEVFNNKGFAYKPYLKEKLQSIYWDIEVLKEMCDDDNE